jgi:hypothetical protein
MKFLLTILTICVTICLTGCISLDTAVLRKTGEEHVVVSNYGWYLFGYIPLACGNAAINPCLPWMLFRDDVTMEKIQYRFMQHAKNTSRTPSELNYYTNDSVMFEIPGLNFPLPIPYILTYKEVQLSGVLK